MMMDQDDDKGRKVLRGALAGLVAGIAASFVMDAFQSAAASLSSPGGDEGASEPATEKAADGVAQALTGRTLEAADKPLAGQAMHYALGIGLGVAYGVAAEFRPSVTTGMGTAFGIATATVLDETAVPALGLGQAPWKAGVQGNLFSYASHLVFGSVAELARRQVAASLRA
jgi:putative membrane protein